MSNTDAYNNYCIFILPIHAKIHTLKGNYTQKILWLKSIGIE